MPVAPSPGATPVATLADLWRRFRRGGELRPLVCLAASAVVALTLAGVAMALAWGFGMTRAARPGTMLRGDVRDADVRTALIVAGVVWLVTLVWLWRPAIRLNRHERGEREPRHWVGPLVTSGLIVGVVTIVSYTIERRPWDQVQYMVTGLSLLAGGVGLAFWLPVVFRLEQGRAITGSGGRVNVHCPECGYSMVGLRETVCPECGRVYTIDELIKIQDYAGLRDATRGES